MTVVMLLGLVTSLSGNFIVRENVDPINGGRRVIVSFGEGNLGIAFGCTDTKAQELVAKIMLPQYVGYSSAGILAGGLDLEYKIDDRPGKSSRWAAGGHYLQSLWDRVPPTEFILALRHSKTIYLRAWKSDTEAVEMKLTYADPAPLVDRVLEQCGFTPAGKRVKKWKGVPAS